MTTLHDEHIEHWLVTAIEQAEKSWTEGGIPIGAVLANSMTNQIVARGHNQRVQSGRPGDPTAHAEVVCIRNAGRRRDWKHLTLISTLSPCIMCSGTAILLKIPNIIIGENATFVGAEELLKQRGTSIQVMNDHRCIELMQRMMQEKPDLWLEDIGE